MGVQLVIRSILKFLLYKILLFILIITTVLPLNRLDLRFDVDISNGAFIINRMDKISHIREKKSIKIGQQNDVSKFYQNSFWEMIGIFSHFPGKKLASTVYS